MVLCPKSDGPTGVTVVLTPGSDYIELRLPTGAQDIRLLNSKDGLAATCGAFDIAAGYLFKPTYDLPGDVRLVSETDGKHYSHYNPEFDTGPGNACNTRWCALAPAQERPRVAINFNWQGATKPANSTDRCMWTTIAELSSRPVAAGRCIDVARM